MQRCKFIQANTYNCIQWTGDNYNHIKEELGGKVAPSPFSESQLTLKGGDAYVVMGLNDWILWGDDGHLYAVSGETFSEHYEVIEADKCE